MTKIDIFSGFLGAGKTTLIKKLIKEAYGNEKLVLIENEFGEIGIDGGFLQDAGIEITEMNSGCICCSLVGDFGEALSKVLSQYNPDRILIEPSGVGKLSDVEKAVKGVLSESVVLNGKTAVVDYKKCKMYMKNFGEFFNNQIEHATSIILSHTASADEKKLADTVALIREHNPTAEIVTTDWEQLTGEQILSAIERKDTLKEQMEEMHHHHHHHDEHCTCHEHHHHHHDEHCTCGCHDHDHHHHHHHADEVFTSFGVETTKKFTAEQIENALDSLLNEEEYGIILRAKGIVASAEDKWIHFDYVPGEADVRFGTPAVIGRLCVIGSKINEEKLKTLFEV